MDTESIGVRRLGSQQIAVPDSADPGAVVQRLGAVQAQDYLGALWAVGLRTVDATEQRVETALAERRIVRTWPIRGTLHLVAPADARWMLALLTPRIAQRMQTRHRQLGLDSATFTASAHVLSAALAGGGQLTRAALFARLAAAGIAPDGQRGIHILGRLAQDGLLCFGARAGKQPTFTLLEEWIPPTPALPRGEALAALALRYFTGHGPATLHDLVWWSGLTTADARAGLAAVAEQLMHETYGGERYYAGVGVSNGLANPGQVHLLPPFDEFLLGYRDRTAVLDPAHSQQIVPGSNGIFNPIIVIAGRVVGTWKRTLTRNSVTVSVQPFVPLPPEQHAAVASAAARYGYFLGVSATLS